MDVTSVRVASASRPHPAETENGDAWLVQRQGSLCRVSLIDGVGHGPPAAAAAKLAVRSLESNIALSPADAIRRCHAGLAGTRGVVMGVASLDLARGILTYSAIGNTEAILNHDGRIERLISYRGIVGSVLPTIRTIDVTLSGSWQLLMHTDGVSRRFDPLAELSALTDFDRWPHDLLERYARHTDDATVVLVSSCETVGRLRTTAG